MIALISGTSVGRSATACGLRAMRPVREIWRGIGACHPTDPMVATELAGLRADYTQRELAQRARHAAHMDGCT